MDTSLRAISARVKEKIKELGQTSYGDICSFIISEYQSGGAKEGEKSLDNTLRRRVYDVIAVLNVLNYVTKVDKHITWTGKEMDPEAQARKQDIEMRQMRIESKRENLKYKTKLLLLYKALIEMRKHERRPHNAVSLPTVLVQESPADRLFVTKSVTDDGKKQLVIGSNVAVPYTYAPLDILSKMSFPDEIIKMVISSIPELPSCGILRDSDSDEEEEE